MKRRAEESTEDTDINITKRAKKVAEQPPQKTFTKLRVNSIDVAVGDVVKLNEFESSEAYGLINKIFKDHGSGDPMVNITWFYKPSDVLTEEHEFLG
jgi:hypothetical protein